MISVRYWMADVLLALLRRVYPGERAAGVWQIVEVPRRISKTEADQIAEQVTNL